MIVAVLLYVAVASTAFPTPTRTETRAAGTPTRTSTPHFTSTGTKAAETFTHTAHSKSPTPHSGTPTPPETVTPMYTRTPPHTHTPTPAYTRTPRKTDTRTPTLTRTYVPTHTPIPTPTRTYAPPIVVPYVPLAPPAPGTKVTNLLETTVIITFNRTLTGDQRGRVERAVRLDIKDNQPLYRLFEKDLSWKSEMARRAGLTVSRSGLVHVFRSAARAAPVDELWCTFVGEPNDSKSSGAMLASRVRTVIRGELVRASGADIRDVSMTVRQADATKSSNKAWYALFALLAIPLIVALVVGLVLTLRRSDTGPTHRPQVRTMDHEVPLSPGKVLPAHAAGHPEARRGTEYDFAAV